MPGLPPLEPSEFSDFFRAIHGQEPFPWQTRLAHLVLDEGWPKVLDLPTGVGKTAALDVAVFALASQAGRRPLPSARRIVFVVDRRTVVDQAFDRARIIESALASPTEDVLVRVANRLSSLSADGYPLATALMRGGIARDDGWARTPDQPLIAVSTVDQAGSRLLFRGYGVSDGMKPVHAGLLGHDVLYLLDEVHLSQPFKETLDAIGTRYRAWATSPLPGAFQVVEMSATPGADEQRRAFGLDDDDRRDPVLSRRLSARKPVALREVPSAAFQRELSKEVLGFLEQPGVAVAVVVNRVAAARECHRILLERLAGADTDVHLLTGRMRPHERAQLETSVIPRIRAGRQRDPGARKVVVVATQSIEAGADFDFDGLVTECASLDALRQRFGRLDRIGHLDGAARGVIVAQRNSFKDDPVYGDALGKTWLWLQALSGAGDVDFGVSGFALPAGEALAPMLSPRAHAPVLLPSHLDAWVQTAPMPDPDPDVALWLHGPRRAPADVQVVWRADLPDALLRTALGVDGIHSELAVDIALGIVDAVRPSAAEAMALPFLAVRRWLTGRPEPDSADVEGGQRTEDEPRGAPPESRPAVLWQGESSRVIGPADLRPGQTLVVPASYGGVAHGNWAPDSDAPVADIAEQASRGAGRPPVLRLHPNVIGQFGAEFGVPLPGALDPDEPSDRELVLAWLERVAGHQGMLPWAEIASDLLRDKGGLKVDRVAMDGDSNAEFFVARGRLGSPRARGEVESETDDGNWGAFTGVAVTLAGHSMGVARTVEAFTQTLDLPDAVGRALQVAAAWHDAGKADIRFQRWLHGGSEFKALAQSEPMAKSRFVSTRASLRQSRERAGYPRGARHEVMSVALMDSATEALSLRAGDAALARHLVGSHHGHCRALAPFVPDPLPVEVTFSHEGLSAQTRSVHALARLDSGVADRFWYAVRAYGWWGAAWLETIFRLSDHRQSERETRGIRND